MENNIQKKVHNVYISTDTETAGLTLEYSVLSLGSCNAYYPDEDYYYTEIKPRNDLFSKEALECNKLDFEKLKESGENIKDAFVNWINWLEEIKKQYQRLKPEHQIKLIYVGWNAAFDWSFINTYLNILSLKNPFHYTPICIKSLVFALFGSNDWTEKGLIEKLFIDLNIDPKIVLEKIKIESKHPNIKLLEKLDKHHALADCVTQALVFKKLQDKNIGQL